MLTTRSARRIGNAPFLILVAFSIVGGLEKLGITDPFTVVLLTTALGATAARRVLDPSPAWRCSGPQSMLVATSVVSWLAIGLAASQSSQGMAAYSFFVPFVLRAAGGAVLVAHVLQPLVRGLARPAGSRDDGPMRLSTQQVVVIAGVCIASANLAFVALGAAYIGGLVLLRSPMAAPAEGLLASRVLAGVRFFVAD